MLDFKKSVLLSMAAVSALAAADVDLGVIDVIEKAHSQEISNVSGDEVKSADLAEALYKQVPSINISRRSGIANDIILRGQKRDNINVLVDDAKIYGGCPNRMDPPSSHILTSNIEKVTVSEGPFNVEDFGTLSGSVKVETRKPKKGFKGDVNVGLGSFNYKKVGATLEGGTDSFKYLITGAMEEGDQYKDGDGYTLAEQLANANTVTADGQNPEYQDRFKDMKAYDKKTFMSKFFIDLTDKQDLELSYTLNRSGEVLYPNSKMDALYDDSDIVNAQYTIKELGSWSEKLQFKAYNSKVDHPMSTANRLSSDSNLTVPEDSNNRMINALTTNTSGVKIINEMNLSGATFTTGLDGSSRNWDGTYEKYANDALSYPITGRKSIDDVDTVNGAIFAKYSRKIDKLKITIGARYNDTTIATANTAYTDRTFAGMDANTRATYKTEGNSEYFIGLGQASRVPDARELYFNSAMNVMSGTSTLKQTTNREIDLGFKKKFDKGHVKFKIFYSQLEDYIYFNKGNTMTMGTSTMAYQSFENIDASIYGAELKASYDLNNDFFLKFSAAYQRGQKDKALTSTNWNAGTPTVTQQTNLNLADMTPLKATLSLNYEPNDTLKTMIEVVSAAKWDKFDSDNGEQALAGYGIVNLKAKKSYNKKYEVTVGVDNVFDKTYAVSNTYADLTLLSDGTTSDVMLLNEAGTYVYANVKYKF